MPGQGFDRWFEHPRDVRDAAKELERAEAAAVKAASIRQQAAEAHALRELAEMHCPPDLIEYAKRHSIPTFAEATWQAGFMQGWKMGLARMARHDAEREDV